MERTGLYGRGITGRRFPFKHKFVYFILVVIFSLIFYLILPENGKFLVWEFIYNVLIIEIFGRLWLAI